MASSATCRALSEHGRTVKERVGWFWHSSTVSWRAYLRLPARLLLVADLRSHHDSNSKNDSAVLRSLPRPCKNASRHHSLIPAAVSGSAMIESYHVSTRGVFAFPLPTIRLISVTKCWLPSAA